MKTLFISLVLSVVSTMAGYAAGEKIKVIDLIEAALNNRGNIEAMKTEIEIAGLQTSAVYSKYLPQITAAYDFRYNIISPTQIIPVGQFSPVPTDEKRAIRFGTDWQQNAGVTLYQPLIDLSVRSRIAESRINEKLKSADAAAAERDLKSEVIRSFILVGIREQQLASAAADTLRTGKTLEMMFLKADEGEVLKTDINRANLNHNNTLVLYREAASELMKEKIYLGFLTGYPLGYLLEGEYDFSSVGIKMDYGAGLNPLVDSIPEIEKLKLQAELAGRQEKTEIRRKVPVVGVDGFLGASQYTDAFDPFGDGTWYGNSYVGLSLRLPIVSGDNTKSRINQLRLEAKSMQARMEDERARVLNNSLRLSQEIKQLEYQLMISEQNASLLEENISLYQERFLKGLVNAYDLIAQEIDLQKERVNISQQQCELLDRKVELITNSGYLETFVEGLRSE